MTTILKGFGKDLSRGGRWAVLMRVPFTAWGGFSPAGGSGAGLVHKQRLLCQLIGSLEASAGAARRTR